MEALSHRCSSPGLLLLSELHNVTATDSVSFITMFDFPHMDILSLSLILQRLVVAVPTCYATGGPKWIIMLFKLNQNNFFKSFHDKLVSAKLQWHWWQWQLHDGANKKNKTTCRNALWMREVTAEHLHYSKANSKNPSFWAEKHLQTHKNVEHWGGEATEGHIRFHFC